MKTNPLCTVVFAAFGLAVGLGGGLKAEPPEVTLKGYSDEFIYFSDQLESIGGSIPSETQPTAESDLPMVEGFSISIKAWATGIQETPEAKMQFRGITYILPSRKIVVPGPIPKENGVFVESALDPNGSGNFEVVVVVNQPAGGFEQRELAAPSLDDTSLPRGLKTSNRSSRSSTRSDQKASILRFILRNDTGQPFVLTPEHFKNLPATKDWPLVEVPPTRPKA